MGLRPDDEFLHAAPDPTPGKWQENLFFILWDTAGEHGFLVHLQRAAGQGFQEAQMVVSIGGTLSSGSFLGPYAPSQQLPEFEFEPVVPFERLRLRAAFGGSVGRGPLGFLALGGGGDTPTSVDVTLESALAPADFAEALAQMVASLRADSDGPQMGDQQHYEQGGTWHGRLRFGQREVETSGLFVRDHSWGVRDEQHNFKAFWTASCLDEGRLFCNAIGIPRGGGVVGIGIVVDGSGPRRTSEVAADFFPAPGIGSYYGTRVRFGEGISHTLAATTQLHVPIALPHSGPGRYDNNAISTVELDGKRGFGVMEWAAVLDDRQAAQLQSRATKQG